MFFAPFVLVVLAPLCIGQPANEEPIEVLIRKLGSDSGRMREAATKALLDRPDSAPALRRALRSEDTEVARRARHILDHFDLKRLDDAVAEGRFDRLLDALNESGNDDASWQALNRFGQKIIALNKKQSAFPPDLDLQSGNTPVAFKGGRIPARVFVRAKEAGWDDIDLTKTFRMPLIAPAIVSSGPVRFRDESFAAIVLARGPVEIDFPFRSLIVCGGDVKIKRVANSLVIAKGKVSCSGSILLSRIVSSNSVEFNAKNNAAQLVTENDPNPLGYIRWSDAPKDKAAPKAK